MIQYWEWIATDKTGNSRTWQTKGYDVSEATMLEFLREKFRGMTFSGIRRIREGECKPRTGIMQTHCYQFGLMEAVMRELNGDIPAEIFRPKREAISRAVISPISILQRRRSVLEKFKVQ